MVEIREINDIGELASYRLVWNSWLPQTPRATFFNSYDWLEAYWRHFGRDQQLRALVACSSGTPIGVVPLCVRVERRRVGTVRVLTYPFDNWGTWYGPVGSNLATTMLAVTQYLRHAPRDWDVLDLPNTAPASHDGSRTGRSLRVVGLGPQQRVHQTHSIVDFNGDWNSFLAAKPRKLRHEVRRVLRRTFERSDVEFIRHRPEPARAGDGDPRWDLYAMCEHVALASWQATSKTGNTLTHDGVRPFLRDAHAAAARNGMVDVNLAIVDGRPAAFAYNYHYDGRVSVLRIGYDPAIDISGMGSALLLRMLEDGCERGDRAYDLGPGDARFQRKLRTHVDASYRLTHWPLGSWRSSAMWIGQWARRQMVERAAS
jgi:CelD/BcsL family acetyltransferase involved in cellulose biosynthesis